MWRRNKDISRVVVGYFNKLYSTQGSTHLMECIQVVAPRVIEEMNGKLLQKISEDEVQAALFQMHQLKSLWAGWFSCNFLPEELGYGGQRFC